MYVYFIYSLYACIVAGSDQPKVSAFLGLPLCSSQDSLCGHAHHVLDHVSDAIEDVVVMVVCLPHEGRSADHLVLLIHMGLVEAKVKENQRFVAENIMQTNAASHLP